MTSEAELSVAYTPHQQAVISMNQIDPERVSSSRSRSSLKPGAKNPYSLAELKQFQKQLGIKNVSGKPNLVRAIREKLNIPEQG